MDPSGRLGFTRVRDLLIAAGAGVMAALLLVLGVQLATGQPPVLPWTGPAVLLFVAAVVAGLAWSTWRRVQSRRERIEPERGLMMVALGKASALGGAAIAAGYLAFVGVSVGNLSATGPQQRLVRGLVAAFGGVLIAAAGLWLERACKVPDDPDSDLPEQEDGNSQKSWGDL